MKNQPYDHLFKLLIIGESGVGKTCLLLRFTEDTFTANHLATVGIDYKMKVFAQDNKVVKLQIWDTAGQDRFRTITKTYYKGAHGIILTYDVTDLHSFQAIQSWMKQIEENAASDVKKVLVANKSDKEDRKVTEEQGRQLAKEYNLKLFETSAKSNKNIQELFAYSTQELIQSANEANLQNVTLKKVKTAKKSKVKCCK